MVLTPEFATATKEYSATTNNEKDKVTAVSLDKKDKIEIKLNGTKIENKSDAQWTEGANTLVVTVKDGYTKQDIVYTVTVTYTTGE